MNDTETQEKDSRGYVKFTGDYSKLKGMGFTFQKLFANNYMQWERNSFRVWKKGGANFARVKTNNLNEWYALFCIL